MKRLILASNNKKKIKEMKEILKELDIEVKSLENENINIDVIEDGHTFEENAKKKAKEIYEFLLERGDKDFIVLADDSGLAVEYLNGEPGIYSARYAGEHGNDAKNNEKLLGKLKNVKKEDRSAKFICQLAMFTEAGEYYKVTGEANGYIIEELHGEGGFGYDPLFFFEPLNKTFAELTSDEKNEISHRGNALKELKKIIVTLL
ncbi:MULTISPECIES: XTP/dITP diphosphatase [Clostridium]|uniref:dITP/XTP pyrophosphatase n=1 Tax=Clostridium saccharoperbutylacetonicum N1-4(HMT) TaxID=931276 RepID=M1MH86_9CLOT|nr:MULTISPECIES: XTP/dITP diphosphatase [Clostridium]AGF54286.1 Non-canonical purine NTP pyrophosphatase [Clostridium saccharoperbutylacetonicum N1-4(HMT)]AQR93202.1 Non-canonical purine NTP pyrophosphatase [Clostridium saccharoperbutylacetonicum]NRT59198.1 XTP/dITP diphosphohydrolase [Clostridium saccharoperbutylacetonicum]NSB28387.1 XTP/dITP diphosphohydrolase [Clostridium saccharoperbutylacetonicum]NSB34619.1 XTP/dITP diphosphohydrolase [Clostridium saccharoperbutylacetonicum]